MGNYPTPHIDAKPGDFGRIVLMPGDPLRAELIAKNYLVDAKLVNNVRGIQGYTGQWKGQTVSVMGSGMGMPSIGIYSYELFNFFGVDAIIRVGSAGGLQSQVKVKDLVLGMGASTNSSYAEQFKLGAFPAPLCSFDLLETAVAVCREKQVRFHVGNLISSDRFYDDDPDANKRYAKMGILAVEMEAAALYLNAMRSGKQALAICSVSDHIFTRESLSAEERRAGFGEMIEVALESAVRFLQMKEN